MEQSEIDRLRALPYLGYSSKKVDRDSPTGVVRIDRELSHPGYNLYSNFKLCSVELIDGDGNLVRTWADPASLKWSDCELTADGNLLVVGSYPGGGRLLKLSWEGERLWEQPFDIHHEIETAPNDSLTILTRGHRRVPGYEHPIRDNSIVLLSPDDGRTLEQLSLFDALADPGSRFEIQHVGESAAEGRATDIDLIHANSVRWIDAKHLQPTHPVYGAGNILVTSRHQNAVFAIDWKSRAVAWSWGQGIISGPHDASVLDNGNILLFDNGLDRGWSRVIELDPLSERIVWEYKAPTPTDFFTAGRGSCQRLPNGNTLIANSDNGEAFEVTHDGRVVWEFLSPHTDQQGRRASIVRIRRLEVSFLEDLLIRVAQKNSG